MSRTSVVLGSIAAAFVLFVTLRGDLPRYKNILGL